MFLRLRFINNFVLVGVKTILKTYKYVTIVICDFVKVCTSTTCSPHLMGFSRQHLQRPDDDVVVPPLPGTGFGHAAWDEGMNINFKSC